MDGVVVVGVAVEEVSVVDVADEVEVEDESGVDEETGASLLGLETGCVLTGGFATATFSKYHAAA